MIDPATLKTLDWIRNEYALVATYEYRDGILCGESGPWGTSWFAAQDGCRTPYAATPDDAVRLLRRSA